MATVQKFIPAGSRVVGFVTGDKPAWVTLKMDQILTESEYPHCECPVTGESVAYKKDPKFTLYFPDRVVQERLILEKGDLDDERLKNFKPCYLTYDIPDDAMDYSTTPPRKFPNPSKYLRCFAIRVNKSDWLMDAGDEPKALMARMIGAGGTPKFIRLHPEDAKRHMEDAIMAVAKEVATRVANAYDSQADATEQLEVSDNPEAAGRTKEKKTEPKKAAARFQNRAKAITRELSSLAADLSKALSHFGVRGATRFTRVERLTETGATIAETTAKRAAAFKEPETVDENGTFSLSDVA